MSKSSIITGDEVVADLLLPVTPGELLKEEFLVPMGISQYRLAKETGIPAQRIGQIVLGRRRVTADTDLRLCRYFGLTDGYWLRAQMAFDLEAEKRRIEPELDKSFLSSRPSRCRVQRCGVWSDDEATPAVCRI